MTSQISSKRRLINRIVKKRLEKLGVRVGIVTGAVPSKKRQAVVDKFQEGEYDVILGNIMALIQHLVVDGSIESRMAVALLEKMGIIHDTLDRRDD